MSALKLGGEAAATSDSKTPLEMTSDQHPTRRPLAIANLSGLTTGHGFRPLCKGLRIKASSDTSIPISD